MIDPDCFALGPVTIYPAQHGVRRNGHVERIEPRLMALLLRLAEAPGAVVTRPDLLDAAWPEGSGSDEGLTKAVSELRRALGDTAREARFVETVPKRGYRLAMPVEARVPPLVEVRSPRRRPSRTTVPLWAAIVLLALGLIGQWVYVAQKPTRIEHRVRVAVPAEHAADLAALPLDSLLRATGLSEGTPVAVRRVVRTLPGSAN